MTRAGGRETDGRLRTNAGRPPDEHQTYRCKVNRIMARAAAEGIGTKEHHEKCALSDPHVRRGGGETWQCFRVRAGVFARAHGRPNGMPGRIIGARAKRLRSREGSELRDESPRDEREDLKLEISDLRAYWKVLLRRMWIEGARRDELESEGKIIRGHTEKI